MISHWTANQLYIEFHVSTARDDVSSSASVMHENMSECVEKEMRYSGQSQSSICRCKPYRRMYVRFPSLQLGMNDKAVHDI